MITVSVNAQLTTDGELKSFGNGVVYSYAGVVDTSDTVTTKEFSLAEFDGFSFYDYPLSFQAFLSGGTASTQKVSVYLLGSNFNDATKFVVVDTALFKDSSLSSIYPTAINLNGKRYARYKWKITGETGNVETNITFAVYAYKRE
jgi:hypothetical protein